MAPDPVGLVTGIPALIQLIAQACRRIKDLQSLVKGGDDLYASLKTLQDILDDVIVEYKKSMNLVNPRSRAIATLESAVGNCRQTCQRIDEHLYEIQRARWGAKTLVAWWESSALQGLEQRLDRQKQDLSIQMSRVSQEYNRISGSASRTPSSSRPPSVTGHTEIENALQSRTPLRLLPETNFGPPTLILDGTPTVNPFYKDAWDATRAYSKTMGYR